ncbi:MAG TPA: hypothetical protein VHB21_11445 [Minicystis sp.]|nr:hypothetical protein [Minicystis sp.]
MTTSNLSPTDQDVHPLALVRAFGATCKAAEAAALGYLDRFDGDLRAAGDAIGDDVDRAAEELAYAEEQHDLDAIRVALGRLAAVAIVWLAVDGALRVPR